MRCVRLRLLFGMGPAAVDTNLMQGAPRLHAGGLSSGEELPVTNWVDLTRCRPIGALEERSTRIHGDVLVFDEDDQA